MVKSQLVDEVNYNELKEIEEEDDEYSAPIYDYKLHGKDIEIGLGKPKHTYSRYGIVYFPVYLIVNSELVSKIGVFEIEDKKMIDVLDDDGDIKLDKKHLLFFISKDYLMDKLGTEEKETKAPVPEEIAVPEEIIDLGAESLDIDDVAILIIPPEKKSITTEIAEKTLKDGIFEENKTVTVLPMLQEESKEQSDQIKKEFQESTEKNWLQNFRRKNNYGITKNKGGGEGFFAVIRDA